MTPTSYHPNVHDGALNILTLVIADLIPRRRRKYPLRTIVAMILHRVDNGCKWRALDRVELPWHVAYDYFRRWARTRVIERANAITVNVLRFSEAMARTSVGAPAPAPSPGPPRLGVVDSRSIRAPGWGRHEATGIDGHKRVNGVKSHALVDTRGHLLARACSPANGHDGPYLATVVARARWARFDAVTRVLGDGAYRHFGGEAAALGCELEITTVPEAKRLEASGFVPIPRRWVIERTFAQMRYSRAFDTCRDRLARHFEATVM